MGHVFRDFAYVLADLLQFSSRIVGKEIPLLITSELHGVIGDFYDDVSEYNYPTTRIGYFPSCPKPLLQNEAECKAIDKKMILYS